MNPTGASPNAYPNKLGRILFLAMEEVLGSLERQALLEQAGLSRYLGSYPPDDLELLFHFSHLGALSLALEGRYGAQGGRGMATRIGRACFKYGLQEFGNELGLTDLKYRTLPLKDRLNKGVSLLADILNRLGESHVGVEQDDASYFWNIQPCPVCWERVAEVPVCHLAVGTLQEALSWISGGKHYNVVERQCVAAGAPSCTIVIDKQPVE